MKIHPTAIIDPKAELHETVEVGPYSIIEGDVQIGEGSWIESCVRLEGRRFCAVAHRQCGWKRFEKAFQYAGD